MLIKNQKVAKGKKEEPNGFSPKNHGILVAFIDLLYEENQGSSPHPPLSTIELSKT